MCFAAIFVAFLDSIETISIMQTHANFCLLFLLIYFSSMEFFFSLAVMHSKLDSLIVCFILFFSEREREREMSTISNSNSDQPLNECTITIDRCVCISFLASQNLRTNDIHTHAQKTTINMNCGWHESDELNEKKKKKAVCQFQPDNIVRYHRVTPHISPKIHLKEMLWVSKIHSFVGCLCMPLLRRRVFNSNKRVRKYILWSVISNKTKEK